MLRRRRGDLGRPTEWIWKAVMTMTWPYEAYRLDGRFYIAFMRELARVFRSGVYVGNGVWNARISRTSGWTWDRPWPGDTMRPVSRPWPPGSS